MGDLLPRPDRVSRRVRAGWSPHATPGTLTFRYGCSSAGAVLRTQDALELLEEFDKRDVQAREQSEDGV
jgi:hypothetical protein